jgi:hypothetical protein
MSVTLVVMIGNEAFCALSKNQIDQIRNNGIRINCFILLRWVSAAQCDAARLFFSVYGWQIC